MSGPSSGATERDESEPTIGECIWCERERELVDDEHSEGFLVAGPDDNALKMTYGDVCEECWEDIREQWETTGGLSKPLTAYGGGRQ